MVKHSTLRESIYHILVEGLREFGANPKRCDNVFKVAGYSHLADVYQYRREINRRVIQDVRVLANIRDVLVGFVEILEQHFSPILSGETLHGEVVKMTANIQKLQYLVDAREDFVEYLVV